MRNLFFDNSLEFISPTSNQLKYYNQKSTIDNKPLKIMTSQMVIIFSFVSVIWDFFYNECSLFIDFI